jgi:hypothetical protein
MDFDGAALRSLLNGCHPRPVNAYLRGAVAAALELPFVEILSRTEPKRWHGPLYALPPSPVRLHLARPGPYNGVDLVTTGATMRRSSEATRAAGVAAFGVAVSGT